MHGNELLTKTFVVCAALIAVCAVPTGFGMLEVVGTHPGFAGKINVGSMMAASMFLLGLVGAWTSTSITFIHGWRNLPAL